MAKIKEQTVGIVSTPPKFGCGLAVTGNVPSLQRYDAIGGRYEPDYTLTPLTIDPDIAVIDGNMPFMTVNARTLLSNIHWYELDGDGKETEIVVTGTTSTPPGYAQLVNIEGSADAGRLQVGKNAAPGEPIRLRFEADVNTGSDIFHVCEAISVQCRDTTPSVRCKFDTPDIVPYNPIHDKDELLVILRVWENNRDADRSHFEPVWEVRRENGDWSEYGQELTDYWLTIAADGCSARLNRDVMGFGVSIRVRLKYDKGGNPGAVVLAPDDVSMPMCRLECSRTLGNYDSRLLGVTNTLADWVEAIRPEVVFKDNKGIIANPDKFFRVTMYAAPAGVTLTESHKVGTGRVQTIPTSRRNGKALKVGYDFEEIDPYLPWADGADGALLTDADGAILLIR